MNRFPTHTVLALSIAVLLPSAALAQDHSGHHGHATAQAEAEVEPEAPAKPSDPATPPTTKPDPHADHAAHLASPQLQDAHAGHAVPQQHPEHSGPAPISDTPLTPIPPVTDADRAAAFPPLHKHMEHAPEFNWYVGIQFLIITIGLVAFMYNFDDISTPYRFLFLGLIITSGIICGAIFENKRWVIAVEYVRLALAVVSLNVFYYSWYIDWFTVMLVGSLAAFVLFVPWFTISWRRWLAGMQVA